MGIPRNLVKAQGIWFHFTKFMVPPRTCSWILAFLQTQYCYLKTSQKNPESWIGFLLVMENSGSSAVLKYELHNFNLLLSTGSGAQTWLVSEDLWSSYSLFLGSPFRHRLPTFQPPGESGRASVSAFTMIVTWHVGVLLRFTGRVKKRNAENKWKQMRKTGSWTGHARKKSVLTFATVRLPQLKVVPGATCH